MAAARPSSTAAASTAWSSGAPGAGGLISHLKHAYGWDRTRLDRRLGPDAWCGDGIFAHNLVKIAALAS